MTETKLKLIAAIKADAPLPEIKEMVNQLPPRQAFCTKGWSKAEKTKIELLPFSENCGSGDHFILF